MADRKQYVKSIKTAIKSLKSWREQKKNKQKIEWLMEWQNVFTMTVRDEAWKVLCHIQFGLQGQKQ